MKLEKSAIEAEEEGGMAFEIGDPFVYEDFEGRCIDLAEELVGSLLINWTDEGAAGGVIVETEAYLGSEDPACHLSSGKTKRTKPFFAGRGTVYVFKIYRYNNLNVITEYNSHPECILIRALHPTHGIDQMKRRRGKSDLGELATGPGKLTEALGIEKAQHNHTPIDASSINIFSTSLEGYSVSRSRRIGISQGESWPLRFCMEDSDYISKRITPSSQTAFDAESHYQSLQPILSQSLPESI